MIILAWLLITLGSTVSILFWVPRLLNRRKLKEMLGPRYPVVFVIYLANGPMLIFLGGFLLYLLHK